MKRLIRVGSRESKLAVIQAQLVIDAIKHHHPELEFELVTMKTSGDVILDRNLDEVGGKGLFVKELDIGLRSGQIDFAVHSLKDMPMITPEARSRNRASPTRRGSGTLTPTASSAARARGPAMRMTAMAAGGRPEDKAKMVSRLGSLIAPRTSAVGQGRSRAKSTLVAGPRISLGYM